MHHMDIIYNKIKKLRSQTKGNNVMMKKVTITFTVESPDTEMELFDACKDEETSLHETLCQTIHEGSSNALRWLNKYVTDVR